MKAQLNIQEKPLGWLKPAEYNPRIRLKPGDPEFEKIRRSIEEFGYVDPIIANSDGTIIGGHQRYFVLTELGYTSAHVSVQNLSKAEEKALNIALNKIAGEWDMDKLSELIGEIDVSGMDATVTGFDADEIKDLIGNIDTDWFDNRERNDKNRQEGNAEYNEFLEKFELKKTTDDCYTPDLVYDAVVSWVEKEYKLNRENFVRPFFPGGDYQAQKYRETDVVVDNPPFSILAEIIQFYTDNHVKFFLFAPSLTLFSSSSSRNATSICCGVSITYENGAQVATSFVTNLAGNIRAKTCPELYKLIDTANKENQKANKKEIPKYAFPDHVITSSMLSRWSKYGVEFEVSKDESLPIDELDEMKEQGKSIFGKGYLLSERAAAERAAAERAAAERAAAERAAAERWSLSEREKELVRQLGEGHG